MLYEVITDYGYPIGSDDWDGIMFPDIADPNIYAIEVSGDSMLPAYRDGDRLIVSPASDFRRGDRIVVKTKEGEIMVKELKRQSAQMIDVITSYSIHYTKLYDSSHVISADSSRTIS